MAREGLGSGWRCVFANDIDREKAASYAANFGRAGLVVRDVARLTTADLPGRADLAWASFPCQDLCLAGDRGGSGAARSGTFWSFWRLMQALRVEGRAPRLIVIENVTGLLTSHEGRDFDALVSALVEGGYRVGAVTMDAALWLPQSRERVFAVAVDAALDIPDEIVAPGPETPFHPPMLVKACSRQTAPIWWRLPAPPSRNLALVDIVEDTPTGVHWIFRGCDRPVDRDDGADCISPSSIPPREPASAWSAPSSAACATKRAVGFSGPRSASTSPDVCGFRPAALPAKRS